VLRTRRVQAGGERRMRLWVIERLGVG
jgi:hypothetical protein